MLRPQTAQDTATALVQLPALAAAHDSLQRSCHAFVVSCTDYRSAAERRFAADSTVIAKQDAVLRDRPPRRHWSLGLTLGYGGTLARDSTRAVRLYTGPSLTAGLTWTPF